MSRPNPDYRVEALTKGLRVLSLFSEERPTMRLTEVVAETGILMPTVYRIAMTLSADGYLEQLTDGQYRVGVKALSLGFAALRSLDLVDIASSHIQLLVDVTGETANLSSLTGDRVLYLARARNSDFLRLSLQVGSMLPAVYTSMGKLLLSYLDEDELRVRITPASFAARSGPRAIRSLDELLVQIQDIRLQGYAMQDEELSAGVRSVAAPVHNEDGIVVAAISIAVNAQQWSIKRMLEEILPPVMATAQEVSRLLGYR